MPNYVSNTLRIHCEDDKTMEFIGELLFKRNEEDKLEYTMTKLLPMPKEFETQDGYHNFGYYWCYINWGTKWDICYPQITIGEDEIILHYETAWSPNNNWVETFCRHINLETYYRRKEARQKFYIEHSYGEYAMVFGGYLYWKPDMEFEYKKFGGLDYSQKLQAHIQKVGEDRIREKEASLFNVEDNLPQDSLVGYTIFPGDLTEEMITEFLNRFKYERDKLLIKLTKIKAETFREISKDFTPEEIMALYEFRKNLPNDITVKELRNSLIKEILEYDLCHFEIKSNEALIAKLCNVPYSHFYLFIQIIFNSEAIWICQEQYLESLDGGVYL